MTRTLDVTIGFPTDAPARAALALDVPLVAGELPAGRYAALTYTGVENGIKGNSALLDWIAVHGFEPEGVHREAGDAFAGRVEHFIDGPDDDPDPANWRTEVAMKLADEPV